MHAYIAIYKCMYRCIYAVCIIHVYKYITTRMHVLCICIATVCSVSVLCVHVSVLCNDCSEHLGCTTIASYVTIQYHFLSSTQDTRQDKTQDFCTASLRDLRPAIRSTSNRHMGPENTSDFCLNTIIFAINTCHQHDT